MINSNLITYLGGRADLDFFLSGVEKVYKNVSITYGPRGKNVMISPIDRDPFFTKDGVTVARNIGNINHITENAGVRFIKTSSETLNEKVGDGTTTSTIVSYSLLKLAKDTPDSVYYMEEFVNKLIKNIRKKRRILSKSNARDFNSIATLACNGDKKLGSVIGDIFYTAEDFELIEVNRSANSETHYNRVKGFSHKSGYITDAFLTNKTKKQIKIFKPMVVTIDAVLDDINVIVPLMDKCHREQIPMLIMANDYSESVLNIIYANAGQGMNIHPIYNGSFGEARSKRLEDLDHFLYDDKLVELNKISNDKFYVNIAEEVIIGREETLFIANPSRNKEHLEKRIEEIKAEIVSSENLERAKLMERLSSLNASKVYLNLYAESQYAYKELADRVEDAICATRNAKEEGYVIGGCHTYALALNETFSSVKLPEDIKYKILKAFFLPIELLYKVDLDGEYLTRYLDAIDKKKVLNLREEKYESVYKTSIKEPANIMIESLKIAYELFSLFSNTEGVIAEYYGE